MSRIATPPRLASLSGDGGGGWGYPLTRLACDGLPPVNLQWCRWGLQPTYGQSNRRRHPSISSDPRVKLQQQTIFLFEWNLPGIVYRLFPCRLVMSTGLVPKQRYLKPPRSRSLSCTGTRHQYATLCLYFFTCFRAFWTFLDLIFLMRSKINYFHGWGVPPPLRGKFCENN